MWLIDFFVSSFFRRNEYNFGQFAEAKANDLAKHVVAILKLDYITNSVLLRLLKKRHIIS
jgi:hypothetical protein